MVKRNKKRMQKVNMHWHSCFVFVSIFLILQLNFYFISIFWLLTAHQFNNTVCQEKVSLHEKWCTIKIPKISQFLIGFKLKSLMGHLNSSLPNIKSMNGRCSFAKHIHFCSFIGSQKKMSEKNIQIVDIING